MKDNIIGKRLKDLRKDKGLKQIDIANFFEIKDSTVSKWESGKLEPDCDTIVALSKYFKVTADYLLGIE